MTSDIVVQKFGGTSVADEKMRRHAIRRVQEATKAGQRPVVVVSAMGRFGAPYATDTLIDLAKKTDPDIQPRELDLIMACGEIISTVIMATSIRALTGIDTVALTGGQAGIFTDYRFGTSRILHIDPGCILDCTRQGKIPVVAGFQGVTHPDAGGAHGAITTLGRGGSDTTASAIAAAVGAQAVEIFTDVDGVMTADPRAVPTARTLAKVTYREVCEMAHLGAKMLHPRAAEIAMDYDIPLYVRSTETGAPGTLVTDEDAMAGEVPEVTGVTNTGQCAHVTLPVLNESDRTYVALQVFRLLATAGIPIYFVSGTATSVAFVVDKDRVRELKAALNAVVVPVRRPGTPLTRFYLMSTGDSTSTFSAQKQILSEAGPEFATVVVPVTVGEDMRAVSLVGRGLQTSVGVVWRMANCLRRAGVRPLQTADSKLSLSCLVTEESVQASIRALHAEFIERAWEREGAMAP